MERLRFTFKKCRIEHHLSRMIKFENLANSSRLKERALEHARYLNRSAIYGCLICILINDEYLTEYERENLRCYVNRKLQKNKIAKRIKFVEES